MNTLPYSKNNPIFLKKKNPQACFPQKKKPSRPQKKTLLFFIKKIGNFKIFHKHFENFEFLKDRRRSRRASERASPKYWRQIQGIGKSGIEIYWDAYFQLRVGWFCRSLLWSWPWNLKKINNSLQNHMFCRLL